MNRAHYIDGAWYVPVGDLHEMRKLAEDALRLLGENEWTPEDLGELYDRHDRLTKAAHHAA